MFKHILTLLLSVVVLWSIPGSAEVTFIIAADPQPGMRCADQAVPWGQYENLSTAGCIAFQMQSLHNVLTFAEGISADFVWVMGDHTNGTLEAERNALRDELNEHSSLTFRHVMGNHDINTNSCNRWEMYLIDAFNNGATTPLPIWETWEVDGHHFMGVSSELWSWDLRACIHIAEAGECAGINRVADGACSSGGATDNYGTSDCLADHVCNDQGGYAVDQMTALGNFVTAVVADGDAKSVALASHILPWGSSQDAQSVPSSPWTEMHNAKQCNDGDLSMPYSLCTDITSDSYYCPTIDAGDPGSCDAPEAVANWDWRNQVEAHLANLPASMVTYWFAGHGHKNQDASVSGYAALDGETTEDGVEYDFYRTLGTAAPDFDKGWDEGDYPLNYLSGRLVHIDDNGNITQRLIPASAQTAPQGYGVKSFDNAESKRWTGP